MKKTRNRGRQFLVFLLVISFMITLFPGVAMAATDPNLVTKVKLSVTNSRGEVKFTSAESSKYTVTAQEGDSVQVGDRNAEFKVTVVTKENYLFSNIKSKSNVSFSGMNSGVKCTDISADYTTNTVTIWIEVSTVRGRLSEPSSVWWIEDDDYDEFGTAEWDEVEGASRYVVVINDSTLETSRTYLNLRQYLRWGQNNYFKVKAVSTKSGITDSSYVKSDALDLRKDGPYYDDYYYDNGYWDDGYNNDGWVTEPGGNPTGRPGSPSYQRGWVQYGNGDWYYLGDNGQIQTGWIWVNGYKYYLSQNSATKGKMLYDWQKISGNWYYLAYTTPAGHLAMNTNIKSADGRFNYWVDGEGKMKTNYWSQTYDGNDNRMYWYYINRDGVVYNDEITVDGQQYRFDARGYMITGWYQDSRGNWYFYYDNGMKAKNTIINGYRFDNNGKWVN